MCNNCNNNCDKQKHVHELLGSTDFIRECDDCHNHRFVTVTDEAIPTCKSHIHEVTFRTDFDDKHYHEFSGQTEEAVYVGNGKHVHFIKDVTDEEDGHKHKFQAATLIDSPTDFQYGQK